MATSRGRVRFRERIEKLARSGLDGESVQREVVAELRRTIGFDRWCLPTADPGTLVPGSGLADHDYGPHLPRALELEYAGDDFGAKDVVARRRYPASCLTGETGGDLWRSPRWQEVLRPVGIGDVASVACRDAFGTWGWVELYRDRSDRAFPESDLDLLASIAPELGLALRRRWTIRPTDQRANPPPGMVLLDRDLGLVSLTAAAREWMARLPGADAFSHWGMLHAVVYPVATRARAGADERAHALVGAADGTAVMVEAYRLGTEEDPGDRIAVTVRSASARESFELVCRAHGLSPRERQVVALLMAGLGTSSVSRRLLVSPYTVQDHLRSVFAKLGAHNRAELLATFGDFPAPSADPPFPGASGSGQA